MKFTPIDPPRVFQVDQPDSVVTPLGLKDCARIALDTDEQLTFRTDSGAEWDIARKSWGYYATPSLNGRLERFGLRAVLIKDDKGKFVIMLVERPKEGDFRKYLDLEGYTIVCWLDSTEALQRLESRVQGQGR